MGPAGFVAVLAGWITTEVGRQPSRSMACCAPPIGFADRRARRRLIARCLRGGLLHRVRAPVSLYAAADGAAAAARREGPRRDKPARAAGITPAPASTADGSRRMTAIDLTATIWAVHHRFRCVRLCRDGRLRSRPRHSVSAISGEADRDVIINTVAPVWDGNETWLVLGGGGLIAVFPLAYAIIMPAIIRRSSRCCWPGLSRRRL